MNKAKFNYLLDVVIALAFVLAGITGVAFLLMGSGGYQGGNNPAFQTALLGISRTVWSDLHTLSSLVMMAGVGAHLVFHWNWIVCMTKRMLKDMLPAFPRRRQKHEECQVIA